jgi:hypothetical protein
LPAADSGRGQDPSVAWWLELLLWLPAILLAGGIGWLLTQVLNSLLPTAQPGRWLILAIMILPGCRGWLFVLVRGLRSRWLHGAIRPIDEPRPAILWRPAVAGAVIGLLFLLLIVAWLISYFGALLPAGWPWLTLPLLILVNYPAGLAGAAGRLGAIFYEGMAERSQPVASLWQHGPFLILPIAVLCLHGWGGLAAGLLVLGLSIVAASLGKSITGLSRQASLGSLSQSVLFSLVVLVAPIAAGL